MLDQMSADSKQYISASDRISPYLASVSRGNTQDLRSPLYGGRDVSRETIIRLWDRIFDRNSDELLSEHMALEVSERKKIGPYSLRLPYSERRDSLLEYFKPRSFTGDSTSLERARSRLSEILPKARLRPRTLEETYRRSPKSTNWGLPYFESGSKAGPKYLELAVDAVDSGVYPSIPSVLGWRGAPSGPDSTKQRELWMFSHVVSLIELSYSTVLLDQLRLLPWFPAFTDQSAVDFRISSMIDRAKSAGVALVGYDGKAWDKAQTRTVIKMVFQCLKEWFQPAYSGPLEQLEEIFSTSGILTPEGVLSGRNGGVPSGSGFTITVNCLIHLLMFFYAEELFGVAGNGDASILGDDGVWMNPALQVDQISEASSHFNVVANPEKQYVSTDTTSFLQRVHSDRYRINGVAVGVRSTYRTLNGMMSYERMSPGWNGYMDSVRWLMQTENTSSHPLFRQFVRFASLGDEKYGMGTRIQGGVDVLLSLAGGAKAVSEALRISSFPFRERDPAKVATFKTWEVLQQL